MLSSLDITRILAESSADVIGGLISGVEYYRKERAIQLYIKGHKRFCLTMSFHPQHHGFYILPAGKSRLDTTEKYRPFAKDIIGGEIIEVHQFPNDRIIQLKIARENRNWFIIYEIIGPNGNLWLLDNNKTAIASLRKKNYDSSLPYQPPHLPDKLSPVNISVQQINNLITENQSIDLVRILEKNIYGFDYQIARTVLSHGQEPERIIQAIADIVKSYDEDNSKIYAYRIRGKVHYYPFKISDTEPLEKFSSLSKAQRESISDDKNESVEIEFRGQTFKAIKSRIKKSKRLLKNLDNDIEEASQYEKYIQFADLLKINLSRMKRGMDSITVENLYEDSREVEIPLNSKFTGPQNIENYSKRYRKGKEGLELLIRRKDIISQETKALEEALALYESDFENACNQYPELLFSPSGKQTIDSVPRRPYKEYQTSTGLTVLVGKTGADNDRTTFEYARPYELWLHASQCPGSHVVIKYPHKKFEPSKLEIAEAASAAAWASKARNSAKVAVSYTQKKYVRKPRKAKAGLVTIEREKTILVEPGELQKKAD